jgi:ABC-type glycerol-3-phosphate transport system substrate-binding protein
MRFPTAIAGPCVLAFTLALAACGGGTPAQNQADALDEAAEQSGPQAANVLEQAADRIEQENISDPAAAQQALEAAGNAQSPYRPLNPEQNQQ